MLSLLLVTAPASAYPIAKERELGERFSLEAASALPLVREAEVVVFVDRMARRIVSRLGAPQPFDYRFYVVRDPQLNAFAVPGGFVYVHSGLVTRVANDSELAGVLGHEIAHAHAHHIVRQQEKSQLLTYTALAGVLLSVIQPALGAAALGASAAGQLK
ncbi:MAG: M48 family metalloprotease, partial [Candidatus Binatia bacterium]